MRLDKTKALLVFMAFGLLGANGWVGAELYEFKKSGRSKLYGNLRDRFNKARRKAVKDKDLGRWDYGRIDSWNVLYKANLIGKEPPKKIEPVAQPKEQPKAPKSHLPIEEIVKVCSVFGTPKDALVIIEYLKPVDPPETFDTSIPSQAVRSNQWSRHMVAMDEKLRKPFDLWTLKGIVGDGSGAEFLWNGKDKESLALGQIESASEAKSESELIPVEGIGTGTGGKVKLASGKSKTKTYKLNPKWAKFKEIKRVGQYEFVIPAKETRDFRKNPDRLMREVHLSASRLSPRASKRNGGQKSGLAVGRVSSRVAKLGFEAGMIIISINGEPVTTKAKAYSVGQRLYKRGMRSFQVKVLDHGLERTITVHAPDEK